MLLAVDAGNTNTEFAVFRDGEKLGEWRSSTNERRTADEYAVWLTQLMALKGMRLDDVEAVVIASVVAPVLFNLRRLCATYFGVEPMVVGEPGLDIGIEARIDRPEQAGADRLVTSMAARLQWPPPLIVIDFGTATTFDIVGDDGNFQGGVIAPGINLSLEALYLAAARLPRVPIVKPDHVIGRATVPAMQSGIFWGYIGLIEGLVTRIQEEYGKPMTVVGTGGLATLFAEATDLIQHIDRDLIMKGLVEIHRRNS
jgi:type III pantothenate kinase